MNRTRAIASVLLVASTLSLTELGAGAFASPQPETAAATAAPQAAGAHSLSAKTRAVVAGSLGRLATFELGQAAAPTPAALAVATDELRIASWLSPDDTTILRRLIEALSASGDQAGALDATRLLVRLDPSDTVAQLRIVSSRIADLQDADARLAAYQGFLGPKGDKLDPAIRSRLALDAALLVRERGDLDRFAELLARSVSLDATNKDAATIALSFFAERIDDAEGRLELALGLLNADPLDAAAHLLVARQLAAGGAPTGARRFYESYQLLCVQQGMRLPDGVIAEIWLSTWAVKDAAQVYTELRSVLEEQRGATEKQAEQLRAQSAPAAVIPDPLSLRLSVPSARLLVTAASAINDPEKSAWAVTEMERSVAGALETDAWRELAGAGPAGSSPDEQAAKSTWATEEALWSRLLCGMAPADAPALIDSLASAQSPRASRLRGWYNSILLAAAGAELVEPVRAAAVAAFDACAGDPWCQLGKARLDLVSNPSADAGAVYRAYAEEHCGSLLGAWAAAQLPSQSRSSPEFASVARRLDQHAAGVPAWLEDMLRDPRQFMSISAKVEPAQGGAGDPILVSIQIRNTSPMTLAVGPDSPINSTIALTPQLDLGPARIPGSGLEEIADLRRRLRLLPQESLEAVVRVDLGRLGFVLDAVPDRIARVRWRVLQGFTLSKEQVIQAGPLCIATESGLYTRQGAPMARAAWDTLAQAVASGSDAELMTALLSARAKLVSPLLPGQATREPPSPRFTQACIDRLARLDSDGKIMLAVLLPHAKLVPEFVAIDRALLDISEPRTARVVLATRAHRADDAALLHAAASSDKHLAALARTLQERLADPKAMTYSRIGAVVPTAPPPGQAPPGSPPAPPPSSTTPAPAPATPKK
ncbi:MAG: hypothetical protein H7Y88_03120 [Phycisphaerales bacterium]|nr:hypothetical protein [Phycisphaerales bacterium]